MYYHKNILCMCLKTVYAHTATFFETNNEKITYFKNLLI